MQQDLMNDILHENQGIHPEEHQDLLGHPVHHLRDRLHLVLDHGSVDQETKLIIIVNHLLEITTRMVDDTDQEVHRSIALPKLAIEIKKVKKGH